MIYWFYLWWFAVIQRYGYCHEKNKYEEIRYSHVYYMLSHVLVISFQTTIPFIGFLTGASH